MYVECRSFELLLAHHEGGTLSIFSRLSRKLHCGERVDLQMSEYSTQWTTLPYKETIITNNIESDPQRPLLAIPLRLDLLQHYLLRLPNQNNTPW